MAPIIYSIIYLKITERPIDYRLYLPAFLLGVVAIAGNAISNFLDFDKLKTDYLQTILIIFSVLSIITVIVIYSRFGFYDGTFFEWEVNNESRNGSHVMRNLYFLGIGIIILNTVFNIIVECLSFGETDKKETRINEAEGNNNENKASA